MEDVLEVYQRPYDGNEVLVCMDETSKQQVKETRVPRPAAPGLSAAYDYEYERNGVSSLFMLFAPLDGWRRVEVRERRTKVDWAHVIKKLVDEDYPDRDRIVLVMDNLNTHKLSSLYEAFEPAEARRIAERLEIHYTPKHGSWLNMAEIEIGVLALQCLDRRIANQDILRGEVNAWQNQRNRDVIRVDWRFTTEDARIKLKSLYPSIQPRFLSKGLGPLHPTTVEMSPSSFIAPVARRSIARGTSLPSRGRIIRDALTSQREVHVLQVSPGYRELLDAPGLPTLATSLNLTPLSLESRREYTQIVGSLLFPRLADLV